MIYLKLSNENIAKTVKEIQKFFRSLDISKQDEMKICFLFEESLLRYQEKFGENQEFKLIKRKWFDTPKVMIKIFCDPYNPITDTNKKNFFSETIMKNFVNYEGAGVVYRYERNFNEISCFSTKKSQKIKIPGGNMTFSIFLAIIFALILKNFSVPTQNFIAEILVAPILDKLFGLIIAVNIPLVFISIIASICAMDNVSALNHLSVKIFKRFLLILFFVAISTVFVSEIFFPVINFSFSGQISSNNYDELQKIFDLILNIIPQNIVSPFLDKEILQIVIWAMLTGTCITILGERVHGIKNFILDSQKIILEMVAIVFKIMPVIIFLCIFKIFLQNSVSEILNVWKIFAVEYILYIFLSVIFLLKNYFLQGVKILDFLKKIYPACFIALTTSSGSAAMPKNIEICKNKLKISKTLCDFYIPLSHPMCPSMKTASFIIGTFFAAQFSGAEITISQLFIIIFLSIQFAISSSNGGNGGFVAMMGLLLIQVGFSLDSIGAIMIAAVFANISGAISIIIRDCDLLAFSRSLK